MSSRIAVKILDTLLDQMVDNARLGEWDRNSEIAPQVEKALSALADEITSAPLKKEETERYQALQKKIDQAMALCEDRLSQIKPLIEAFNQSRTFAGKA